MNAESATYEAGGRIEAADAAQTGRRTLLKGGVLAVAGLVGWKVAEATTSTAAAGSVAGTTLSLRGAQLNVAADGAMSGDLVDASGAVVGSVAATALAPRQLGAPAGAELMTFTTPAGMIFGLGVPSTRGDEPVTYAVVGGTGQYAGASGSYDADQQPTHTGGDGTAGYQFNFGS